MSFITAAAIQHIAESLAISKVTQDASKALAPHIDVRLREIIQEGCKFCRHSKRSFLTSDDINNALRFYNSEVLHGFNGKDPQRFVRAAGQADLFHLIDLEVPVKQVIERALPKVPVEVGLVPHWLTINGVQPKTAEHAPVDRQRAKRQRIEAARPVNTKPAGAPEPASKAQDGLEQQAAVVIPPLRQVLSAELQVYLEMVKTLLGRTQALSDDDPGGAFYGWPKADGKPFDAEHASPSLQRLQDERALLASLANDPGIHPLAPTLVDLIIQQVKQSIKQIPQLHLLIKIAASLLRNPHIHLELYLHKLISPLMTCMVTKRIGQNPLENHWSVRTAAAEAVAGICRQFEEKYVDLQARICKQLAKALTDVSKPVTTLFGAVTGLTKMGSRAVQLLVLPCAPLVLEHTNALLEGAPEPAVRADIQRLQGAIRLACSLCINAALDERSSFLALSTSRARKNGRPSHKLDFSGEHDARDHTSNQKTQESAEAEKARAGAPKPHTSLHDTIPGKDVTLNGRARKTEYEQGQAMQLESPLLTVHIAAACKLFGESLQPSLHNLPVEQLLL